MEIEITVSNTFIYHTEDYDFDESTDPIEVFKELSWEAMDYNEPDFTVTILSE